jgi:amino acid permease
MIGGIIGAGVFGLPYAFSKSGVAIGLLELLVIGAFLLVLQLMFAEVAIQTPGKHRLTGYIDHYLGRAWKWVGIVAMSFGIWGAMLAYMVIGGDFLSTLFSSTNGGGSVVFSFLIAILTGFMIYGGLRRASRVETVVVCALLFLFVFIIFACLPHLRFENFISLDATKAFLPYGVVLFALTGLGIVPEMKDVLGVKHKHLLAPSIVLGMSLIIILYVFFSLSIAGVTGAQTTQTAFDGLIPYLGNGFGAITSILGALTIISIYSILGVELMNTFKFDFRISHLVAWLMVVLVPVALFAFGVREFIGIIGFVGAVFNGVLGILVALCYFKMRRSPVCVTSHCINFPAPLTWVLVAIFGVGIIAEIIVTIM